MTYRELYFQFFAAMEDALSALETGNSSAAIQILLQAEALGEEAHLTSGQLSEM